MTPSTTTTSATSARSVRRSSAPGAARRLAAGGQPPQRGDDALAVDGAEPDKRQQEHELDQHGAPEGGVQERREAAHVDQRLRDPGGQQRGDAGEGHGGEAHQYARQQATALARLQLARRARKHEEQHDQAPDPHTHGRHVHDVERQQGSNGVQSGRVTRQRGGDQQEPGRQGKGGQESGGGGRSRGDARRPNGGRSQHGSGSGAGTGEQHRAEQQPRDDPQAPDRPEARAEDLAHDGRIHSRPKGRARCGRSLQHDADHAGEDSQADREPQQSPGTGREHSRGLRPAGARSGRIGEGRAPRGQQEGQPSDAQRDGEVVQPAGDAERRLGHRADVRAGEQVGDRLRGPVPALPMLKTTPPETGWLSAEITR